MRLALVGLEFDSSKLIQSYADPGSAGPRDCGMSVFTFIGEALGLRENAGHAPRVWSRYWCSLMPIGDARKNPTVVTLLAEPLRASRCADPAR